MAAALAAPAGAAARDARGRVEGRAGVVVGVARAAPEQEHQRVGVSSAPSCGVAGIRIRGPREAVVDGVLDAGEQRVRAQPRPRRRAAEGLGHFPNRFRRWRPPGVGERGGRGEQAADGRRALGGIGVRHGVRHGVHPRVRRADRLLGARHARSVGPPHHRRSTVVSQARHGLAPRR
jgi:hypothetical protein